MLSFSSINKFLGFDVLKISILSTFWILFSGLIIPSTFILSTIWLFKGSFSLWGINILSFSSISKFLGFDVLKISILSTFCISLFLLNNALSSFWLLNGTFSLCGTNWLSFCSITILIGALNISNSSTFLILFSGLSITSTIIWLFGIFSIDGINKLSFSSTIILIGLEVLNISILSIFCILFSGLSFPSIIKLSTFWFFKGFFSFGGINILSFSTISLLFLGDL